MASISKRFTQTGEVRYMVRVRKFGYPTQTKTFSRKSDAKLWACEIETNQKFRSSFNQRNAERTTLSELIDRYLDDVTYNTRKDFKSQKRLLERARKELGAFTLINLTKEDIKQYRSLLQSEETPRGGLRNNATVNRYIFALRSVLSAAVNDYEWLSISPAHGLKRLPESCGRVRYLSIDEIDRLKAACAKSKSPHLQLLVLLALATGARQGELLKLRWNDVDLKNKRMVFFDTKNGDNRAVLLTNEVVTLLEKQKANSINIDLVFPGKQGNNHTNVRHAFKFATEKANIVDFRFHDLRHTFASHLAMSGATQLEQQILLGHKSPSMVKRYAHLAETHTRKIVERVNRKMSGG